VTERAVDGSFEPFVHLVDVTDRAVLIAWGGFFFGSGTDGLHVVDDDDLAAPARRVDGTIGAQSASYGPAVVEVVDDAGRVAGRAESSEANHVWVHGLEPDTAYRYTLAVDGRPWAEGERRDWVIGADRTASLRRCGRRYDLSFRTHPASDEPAPVTFIAFGDYGVGIDDPEHGAHQQGVARTMEALARSHPVRCLVALGDNIYHREEHDTAQSGDEDDDWYLTFYEPYRYLIDHLPLYPAAGNHDGGDEEANDDRAQLEDNFHLHGRFDDRVGEGRASLDPGLFYSLGIGGLLDLVCVDTSWGEEEGTHHFDQPEHLRWLEQALPSGGGPGEWPVWRIPFCHHPPYCAGPHHDNMEDQIDSIIPLYRRAGVKLVLAGHEHNFQHGRVDGIDCVVSGAAGKLREEPPERWDDAGTERWAAVPHCLLVEVDGDRVVVTPYGATEPGDDPRPIRVQDRHGDDVDPRIVIDRER
jgi:tartrate-resistant acid phosphatase type 5